MSADATCGKELAGRVALVTGAARNIGRAIALELAAGGASVVVNTASARAQAEAVVREIERGGGNAIVAVADVTDASGVEGMVRAAHDAFGGIDVLVNNAAIRNESAFESMRFADWQRTLAVVLDGSFLCAQACVPMMRARGGGAIVNIGGLTGHTGARHRTHVVTAKAGLVGFTKALAFDLAEHRITVNCVSPGLIDTARAGAAPKHHAERTTLTGRHGTPEDVAGVVRMLCGPRGSYLTGQTIHVNGGLFMP